MSSRNDPAFRRIGKAEGAPLVLLHGFGGNMRTWNRVFPLLKNDVPLIIFDLPGHGKSIHSDGRGGAGRMAKAILETLEENGIERFHAAGHSMGGAVAALVAMRAPDKVLSLNLIAPGGMAPDIEAGLLERFSKAEDADELEAVIRQMAGPGLDVPEGYFQAAAEFRQAPGAMEALAETYAAMFPDGRERGQGVLPKEQLSALPMPVRALWGADDTVLPCPDKGDLPANFILEVLGGAGHMLPEERPGDVADFLRAAVAPGPA
ncbi:alpha/beta fold hydrolase [Pseudohoeflea suaedae]|uniref:alpha/beta fold hydrolase n=1 Tax=Pseudohoeflea suaedae TaxID=877384 RepID=UPI001304DEE6|nr:alpha/beta fold hydrolase [Pseudohoeflea suaedae]